MHDVVVIVPNRLQFELEAALAVRQINEFKIRGYEISIRRYQI